MFPELVLDKGIREKFVINIVGDGEVEDALGFSFAQSAAVIEDLTEGEMEFVDGGASHKRFNFDGDLLTGPFGTEDSLSGEVDVELDAGDFDSEGIVGNVPAIFFESGTHSIV